MDDQTYARYSAWDDENGLPPGSIEPEESKFRKSKMSYFTLFFLLIIWPAMSVITTGDPAEALKLLSVSRIFFIYLPTIVVQWLLFGLICFTLNRERTGLKGIGFTGIRLIHFFWAIAFLLISNLVLSLLAVLLEKFGIAIVGEIELMLPSTTPERIIWVILSLTAGVCEETAFRGYLITRLQIFGNTANWLIPSIIASIVFGMGHAYQGLGGFVLLTIYGGLFALLYWRTKSLWPPIIAHFFQDFSALFFPFQ
ncbi:MAG: type II CAAX endopeptidase family protein [Candidatus Zixiibacteriota bacterium]